MHYSDSCPDNGDIFRSLEYIIFECTEYKTYKTEVFSCMARCVDPCHTGGICIDGSCSCIEGYYGQVCEHIECEIPHSLNSGKIIDKKQKK